MGQDLGQNLAESGSLLGWVCDAGLGSVLGLGPVPGPGSDPSRSRSCPAVGGQRRGYDSRVYGGQQQPQYWGQPGNRGVRIPGHSGGTSGPCWGTSGALPISKPLPDQFLTLLGLAGALPGLFWAFWGHFRSRTGHFRSCMGHFRCTSGYSGGTSGPFSGTSGAPPVSKPLPNQFLALRGILGHFWAFPGHFPLPEFFPLLPARSGEFPGTGLGSFKLVFTGLDWFKPV